MAFLGKIVASMTHEIKNTYAIILESSGLLSDLLTLQPEGSSPPADKFQKVLGSINEQVHRGVALATRLNQFAHSMDEPVASIKIADLLELVAALMQRLARQREMELEVIAPDRDESFRSDPFRVQLVLASVIDQLAEVLESGGKIILQPLPAAQNVTILCEAQGPKQAGWEALTANFIDSLKGILEALGAELALSSAPAKEGIILTIRGSGA